MELGPGDILMGLTDGMVERRGFDLDEGLAQVLGAAAEPAESLDSLVEHITTTMLGHTAGSRRRDAAGGTLRTVTTGPTGLAGAQGLLRPCHNA